MLKIGLIGIGLGTYWEQFKGLEERLIGYLNEVEAKMQRPGVDVVNMGMVDNTDKAFQAGTRLREHAVDLIFIHATTYALSGTVLPVVQRAKVPVIILNISPQKSIDYKKFNTLPDRTAMTGEWLAHCGACPVPEIANVFKRCGIQFFQVTGYLGDEDGFWGEVDEWIEAAKVAHIMAFNRLGLMGHYYSGMLDIYTDLTQQLATFGGAMEIIEVDELSDLRRSVPGNEVNRRRAEFEDIFDIQPDCGEDDLMAAARTSVALDKLVRQYKLGSLAYYYKGVGVQENADTLATIILGTSKLTGEGIPVAGEYEVKNVQAMKILDTFGVGGSFTEYYALDFNNDIVLLGHDGPGHIKIAEGKTKVKPLQVYHGKVGRGLSVEMSVKHGAVTLLSVVESGEGILFLVAEGESVPGAILEIGNTNSRYKFPLPIREFVDQWNAYGPAHHCAVGIGHIASKIRKLGKLLDVTTIQVR